MAEPVAEAALEDGPRKVQDFFELVLALEAEPKTAAFEGPKYL